MYTGQSGHINPVIAPFLASGLLTGDLSYSRLLRGSFLPSHVLFPPASHQQPLSPAPAPTEAARFATPGHTWAL